MPGAVLGTTGVLHAGAASGEPAGGEAAGMTGDMARGDPIGDGRGVSGMGTALGAEKMRVNSPGAGCEGRGAAAIGAGANGAAGCTVGGVAGGAADGTGAPNGGVMGLKWLCDAAESVGGAGGVGISGADGIAGASNIWVKAPGVGAAGDGGGGSVAAASGAIAATAAIGGTGAAGAAGAPGATEAGSGSDGAPNISVNAPGVAAGGATARGTTTGGTTAGSAGRGAGSATAATGTVGTTGTTGTTGTAAAAVASAGVSLGARDDSHPVNDVIPVRNSVTTAKPDAKVAVSSTRFLSAPVRRPNCRRSRSTSSGPAASAKCTMTTRPVANSCALWVRMPSSTATHLSRRYRTLKSSLMIPES